MPRDPVRIERIVGKLTSAWAAYPDLRLGQLLVNLGRENEADLFDLPDDVLEAALDRFLASPPYVEVDLHGAPAYARRDSPDEHGQFARRAAAELTAAGEDQGDDPEDPRRGE